jgi:hypothetical protein
VDDGVGYPVDYGHGKFGAGDEFLDEEILGMLGSFRGSN